MSQSKHKKQRQFMRREYAKNIREIAEANGQFLKPKPKWFPMWLYIWALKFFIRIK